jgi:glycine dehydrogenase
MIEPTESESLAEVDRFVTAMLSIREEIRGIESGLVAAADSPLRHAPHTVQDLAGDWPHTYSRAQAAYPDASLLMHKFWAPVSRVDNVYGDRNLVCTCPSPEDWLEAAADLTGG